MANPKALTQNFDTDPAVVKRWLEHLPRAHTGELSRQLYEALCSVNRQQVSTKHRLHFLEAVADPLSDVLPALHKHYAGKPVPLSRKRQKVADLYYQLLKQTIIGYQRLITSSLELGRFGWKHTVTTAIHRIFGYHALLLTNARQLYHPYPKGLWQQIYWLYMQIEHHGLLQAKVRSLADPSRKTTLASEFYKLLLHSLLSPNLFKLDELNTVFATMDIWADKVSVTTRLKANPPHVYAFKLNTDIPPGLMAEVDAELASNADTEVRYLLTGELVRQLERLTQQVQGAAGDVRIARNRRLGRRALLLLYNTWGRPGIRNSTRKTVQGRLEMAIGMSAIHYIISNGRTSEAAPVPAPAVTDKNTEDVFLPVADQAPVSHHAESEFVSEREGQFDVWETAYFVPEPSAPSWTESIQMKAYSYQQARLNNVSSGGFCISLDRERVEQIQLNEWVAVRNRQGPWTLGRIRWLLCPTNGPVRAGIERLSAHVQPALLHLQTDNPRAQPIRCLLGNNGQSPMLYLPNLPVDLTGRLLNLEVNGQISRITLLEQAFNTTLGSAHQMERHQNRDESSMAVSRDNEPAPDRYAAIWANL